MKLDRAVWWGICALLVFALWWSVRYARADWLFRENTAESLAKAVELAPGNASYRALLAEHRESFGVDPTRQLLSAAALSPRDAQIWIRLGFQAEVEGRFAAAEQYLLRAATVSRKFAPRWALMNYYYRRGDVSRFWPWAQKALALEYGDTAPVFRLMWETAGGDGRMVRRNIPHDEPAQVRYLHFLIADGHLDVAGEEALEVAGFGDEEAAATALQFVDGAIAANNKDATAVWNRLIGSKAIPFAPLNPAGGTIVTDGDFARLDYSHGFGWKKATLEGISISPAEEGTGMAIQMSGAQPEDCVLLAETMPVAGGVDYAVRWTAHVTGGHMEGLQWEVAGLPGAGAASVSSGPGELRFRAASSAFLTLSLRYRRPAGFQRAEGTLRLQALRSGL